jgi:hypothetical protein
MYSRPRLLVVGLEVEGDHDGIAIGVGRELRQLPNIDPFGLALGLIAEVRTHEDVVAGRDPAVPVQQRAVLIQDRRPLDPVGSNAVGQFHDLELVGPLLNGDTGQRHLAEHDVEQFLWVRVPPVHLAELCEVNLKALVLLPQPDVGGPYPAAHHRDLPTVEPGGREHRTGWRLSLAAQLEALRTGGPLPACDPIAHLHHLGDELVQVALEGGLGRRVGHHGRAPP